MPHNLPVIGLSLSLSDTVWQVVAEDDHHWCIYSIVHRLIIVVCYT
ncbi:hypothetical protein [Paenibacillus sp. 2KB_22]